MSKFNILVKVTGSIAAYKTAYLVSRLVKENCDVKVVATKSALKFVGAATFEGLTGNQVFTDTFEAGKMMSHINLAKWADLTIVVPADANTINKFAAGMADNLVTSLFLAHNRSKPYLIAPAMNVAMLNHPATQQSLEKLKDWGIKVLPTASGRLACGDRGDGKLLEPEVIFGYIFKELQKSRLNNKNVLITSGATREQIDLIRSVSNLSTGKTGAAIADALYLQGFRVTLLRAENAAEPAFDVETKTFSDFNDLHFKLKTILQNEKFSGVIHLAAVSDFSPVIIELNGNSVSLPLKNKLESDINEFKLIFKRNEKIIDKLKSWSLNKNIQVISFKFLDRENSGRKNNEVNRLLDISDAVVFNSLEGRKNGTQIKFEFHASGNRVKPNLTLNKLIEEISKTLRSVK